MPDSKRYPDLFIVGAQRSGTTSLYEYLRQHPGIFMSPHKETHYFSQDRTHLDTDLKVRTLDAYLKLFAAAPATAKCGEASPSYLWHPEVPRRIHLNQPNAKIIAILRDPIRRAFSQYQMDLADGLSPIPFYDLVVQEFYHGEKVYGTGHLYVELGMYAAQLKNYFEVFEPERVLVLRFDELRDNAARVLARVAAFLQIDPEPFQKVDTSIVHNRIVLPRAAPARRFMQYRYARKLYRWLVPSSLRHSVRDHFFVQEPAPEIDARAVEFLQTVYASDLAELETMCAVVFPESNGINTA